jgi:putative addiction module component (TIGR02574 family)
MDYQSILNEVESWPIDDRVRLVQDVWDRLADQGYEPVLTEEMKAELDRRLAEMGSLSRCRSGLEGSQGPRARASSCLTTSAT